MGNIAKLVNDKDLERLIFETESHVVVMFFQVDTPPCSHFLPEFKVLAEGLGNLAAFLKVEVTENPSIAEILCVDAVPTTMVFKDGDELARYEGPYRSGALRARILDLIEGRKGCA